MRVTVLGVRGSVPVSGADTVEYGGATSAYLVEAGGQAIFLDAGTGLMRAPDVGDAAVSLLLSHPHIDHLLGFPFFPMLSEAGRQIDLYAVPRAGLGAEAQMRALMSAPLWPVTAQMYPAEVVFHDIAGTFTIGGVEVAALESVHPGGSTIYRLSFEGRSLVYATDYEHTEASERELAAFARGADLLLYDGQYTEEEYAQRRGYGHSTVAAGLRVMEQSGARRLRYVHHDPRHTDAELRRMEDAVKSESVAFAREGEVVEL